jgi:TIR domain
VDDFHRLHADVRQGLIDYMKYLTDTGTTSKKLALIGIPLVGMNLIDLPHDVLNRIELIALQPVEDEDIINMITTGEKHLNISFGQKISIVGKANGFLNIAQRIWFELAVLADVVEPQRTLRHIDVPIGKAIESIRAELDKRFGGSVAEFASIGEPEDLASINLLETLATAKNGAVSVKRFCEKEMRIDKTGIDWCESLAEYFDGREAERVLWSFDNAKGILIAEDPLLRFYLANLDFEALGSLVGKVDASRRPQVFVSYAHADAEWLRRLLLHLKPLRRKRAIKVWADTDIKPGTPWRDEIKRAIGESNIAILLLSAEFLRSDFIAGNELLPILTKAKAEGLRVLQVMVGPCLLEEAPGLEEFQMVNRPEEPLVNASKGEQDEIWLRVARAVRDT